MVKFFQRSYYCNISFAQKYIKFVRTTFFLSKKVCLDNSLHKNPTFLCKQRFFCQILSKVWWNCTFSSQIKPPAFVGNSGNTYGCCWKKQTSWPPQADSGCPDECFGILKFYLKYLIPARDGQCFRFFHGSCPASIITWKIRGFHLSGTRDFTCFRLFKEIR